MEMDHLFPSLANHPQVLELCRLLGNNIVGGLDDALSQAPTASNVFLRIEGSLCTSPEAPGNRLLLVRNVSMSMSMSISI